MPCQLPSKSFKSKVKVADNDKPQRKSLTRPPQKQGVPSARTMKAAPSIDPDDPAQVVGITVAQYRQLFSGPLPPPETLILYNDAHPGLANRIVTMAEKQQDHRIDIEKKAVSGEIEIRREALRAAFVLGLAIVLGAVYLLANGRTLEGFGTLIAEAAIFVGTYLYGSNKRAKERVEKAKIMAGQAEPKQDNQSK